MTTQQAATPIEATIRPRQDGEIRYYEIADLDPAFTTTLPGLRWTGTYGAAYVAFQRPESGVAYTTLVLRKLNKDGSPTRSRAESARVSIDPATLRGQADQYERTAHYPGRDTDNAGAIAAALRALADRIDATVAAVTSL